MYFLMFSRALVRWMSAFCVKFRLVQDSDGGVNGKTVKKTSTKQFFMLAAVILYSVFHRLSRDLLCENNLQ